MMRCMYAAVGGLRAHQTRMDVIGNNIANVNTTAFKSSRVTFQDVFYQTLSGGAAASEDGTRGGVNPKQVGIGMSVSTIDTTQTQGNVQPTGIGTDLMIQGDGFFVLGTQGDNPETYYTRAGVFGWDDQGNLVNKSNGLFVKAVEGTTSGEAEGDIINVPTNAQSYSIDSYGNVKYVDENGELQQAGQIALAKFSNPEGLIKEGENLYRYDVNAGAEAGEDAAGGTGTEIPQGGAPGESGRGTVVASALEMSNVDLAQEMTDMITTQRGYQANARIITTADEILQELVNMKR